MKPILIWIAAISLTVCDNRDAYARIDCVLMQQLAQEHSNEMTRCDNMDRVIVVDKVVTIYSDVSDGADSPQSAGVSLPTMFGA